MGARDQFTQSMMSIASTSSGAREALLKGQLSLDVLKSERISPTSTAQDIAEKVSRLLEKECSNMVLSFYSSSTDSCFNMVLDSTLFEGSNYDETYKKIQKYLKTNKVTTIHYTESYSLLAVLKDLTSLGIDSDYILLKFFGQNFALGENPEFLGYINNNLGMLLATFKNSHYFKFFEKKLGTELFQSYFLPLSNRSEVMEFMDTSKPTSKELTLGADKQKYAISFRCAIMKFFMSNIAYLNSDKIRYLPVVHNIMTSTLGEIFGNNVIGCEKTQISIVHKPIINQIYRHPDEINDLTRFTITTDRGEDGILDNLSLLQNLCNGLSFENEQLVIESLELNTIKVKNIGQGFYDRIKQKFPMLSGKSSKGSTSLGYVDVKPILLLRAKIKETGAIITYHVEIKNVEHGNTNQDGVNLGELYKFIENVNAIHGINHFSPQELRDHVNLFMEELPISLKRNAERKTSDIDGFTKEVYDQLLDMGLVLEGEKPSLEEMLFRYVSTRFIRTYNFTNKPFGFNITSGLDNLGLFCTFLKNNYSTVIFFGSYDKAFSGIIKEFLSQFNDAEKEKFKLGLIKELTFLTLDDLNGKSIEELLLFSIKNNLYDLTFFKSNSFRHFAKK